MKKPLGRVDLISLSLLVGSLVISILVAEVLTRWYFFGSDAWSYTRMKSIRHVGQSGVIQASPHQDILWELKPNLNVLFKLKNFKTTSDGLRDIEYQNPKPESVFRVAVLGDSYTMGEGIDIEDSYHTLLEDRFNAEAGTRRFEFVNFGVAGYSLPQYRATILHKVRNYQPDLLFIGFCGANDSKKPNLAAFTSPYRVKPLANGFFHFFLFEHIGNVYKRIYHYLRNRTPGDNADEPYVKEEFRKLAALAEEMGTPVVLAYLDNRAASADFEMVRKAAESQNFYFIDASVNFKADVNPDHIIYKTDKHPNGAANRLMAEAIYQALRAGRIAPLKAFQFSKRIN